MNIEKILCTMDALCEDFEQNTILPLFSAMITSLGTKISSPSLQADQNYITAQKELIGALAACKLNEATPTTLLVLEEMGASGYVGLSLEKTIAVIVRENSATLNVALQLLQQLYDNVSTCISQFKSFLSAASYAHLKPEGKDVGTTVSVVFPRGQDNNSLDDLKKELSDFDQIFKTIGEVCADDPTSLKVKSIGSSTLIITVSCGLGIAIGFAKLIKNVTSIYKDVLDIQIKQQELQMIKGKRREELDKLLAGAKKELVKDGISKSVDELMEQSPMKGDKGRKNEVRNALDVAVKKLAKKFDKGFSFEVEYVEPTVETAEDGEEIHNIDGSTTDAIRARDEIDAANRSILESERSDQPILALEPAQDLPNEGETTDAVDG